MKMSAMQLLNHLPGIKQQTRNALTHNKLFRAVISRFMAIHCAHLMAHVHAKTETGNCGKFGSDSSPGLDRDQNFQSAARGILARHSKK